MIIETYSYPRAAVIGNPSDGYFGKTLAFVFSNFIANVQLYQTPELEIKTTKIGRHIFQKYARFGRRHKFCRLLRRSAFDKGNDKSFL